MSKPASLREFALAFRRHWFAAMSSGVGVPFAIMAVFVDIAWGKALLAALAITAVAFAAYRVWSWERENWIEAEAKLGQRLSVSFIPEKEFYETTEPKHASGPALRTFRVSVKNDGPVTLEHCSVRLESLIDANGINTRAGQRRFRQMLDQPINAPGWHKQDFILAPGDSEFIDIVRMDETDGKTKFELCYALAPSSPPVHSEINSRKTGPHTLILRIVGAPEPLFRRFKISVDDAGCLCMDDLG